MFDKPQSIIDVFNQSCSNFKDDPAFTGLGKTISYRELNSLSANFASYLQHHTTLVPGDRIAIQLPNIIQYPVVVFGALRAGLIIVNTNPLYTPRETEHQLCDSGAKALVVLANIADNAAKIIHKTSVETVIVTQMGDLLPPLKRVMLNGWIKHIKRMVPSFYYANPIDFREVISKGREQDHQPVSINPSHISMLQYTGGTTGVAKGVMLSHGNLLANMDQAIEFLSRLKDTRGGVAVAPLPLYHIYAFSVHCMTLLKRGEHNLLIANPRDIPAFIKSLKKHPPSSFVGVNTLFNALCRHKEFHSLDFSRLQFTISGGMALTSSTGEKWKEITGCDVYEGFGLTETSPLVSISPIGEIEKGTVGMPLSGTEIKVIDENGVALPVGVPGELCVRGPQVMQGYWNRIEETRAVLDDEKWLKTGDIALIQDNGYLRIVDRKKDMIIVSGFNVYPNEIEDVVSGHPNVVEAAAIAVDDEKCGEAVKLFIVSSDPSLTKGMLIDYCREYLTAYKVPKHIEFRNELPKSTVGKILRRELK